jgi:hypothetical protein
MEKQLMNPGCIVLRISICILLAVCIFSYNSFGQSQSFDTVAFYKHLKEKNLFMEQIVFAQKLRTISSEDRARKDSLSLDLATAYFNLKMTDSSAVNLKRISASQKFSERKKELYFSSLIISHEFDLAEKNISILKSETSVNDARMAFSILKRENIGMDTSKKISPVIVDIRNRYIHSPGKSAFLAGVYSAVLPGAGKWYIGYKRQGVTALIANVLFAAQAAESYSKAGANSPQFIITAGLFGIFYSGNIWGSVLAAKKIKRDHLNEIDYEILDHYNAEFSKLSR